MQFFGGHLFPIGELLANKDIVFDTLVVPIDLAVFVKTNVGDVRVTTNRTFGNHVSHFGVFDVVYHFCLPFVFSLMFTILSAVAVKSNMFHRKKNPLEKI